MWLQGVIIFSLINPVKMPPLDHLIQRIFADLSCNIALRETWVPIRVQSLGSCKLFALILFRACRWEKACAIVRQVIIFSTNGSQVIGEYLHWCYFSFYVILILPIATLWWRYPRESFITLATAQLLAMTSCSFTWIYYPAKGPYWTLDPRPAEQVPSFFYLYSSNAPVCG